jgi:putative two-component system response regulator
VDDTVTNIDVLVKALGSIYDIAVATNGTSALEIARKAPPDLILLDIAMPGMDGYEVCTHLKRHRRTKDIPVIFLTAMAEVENKTRGFELGAVDYITKPFEILEVQARIRTHLSLVLAKRELEWQNGILEEKVRDRTRGLALAQEATIDSMAVLAEYKDPETGGHIKRTKHYALVLCEFLSRQAHFKDYLTDEAVDLIYKSTPLHDIGKVGVPDEILRKEGKLTAAEFEEMKKHTVYGRDAIEIVEQRLGPNSFLRFAKEIAYSHHERWDGSGYPRGLKEEAIPCCGRLMALADVYDALISKRAYKPAYTHGKAVSIIARGKGSHFDPRIVDAFLRTEKDFHLIALKIVDSDERKGYSTPLRHIHPSNKGLLQASLNASAEQDITTRVPDPGHG